MKKLTKPFISLLVVLVLMISASGVNTFALGVIYMEPSSFDVYGDADGDNNITVKDATAIQKHIAKIADVDIMFRRLADVDADSKLSISDATAIQKFLVLATPCFEADPAFHVVSDGTPVKVEGFNEKVYITILKDGYYRFSSTVSETSYRSFTLSYDYVVGVAGEDVYLEDYGYAKAGVYPAEVHFTNSGSKVFETEISVTPANDKMPLDLSNVRELNDGDEYKIKAGEENLVFYIDPMNTKITDDVLRIYTQGENPKVSFEFYYDSLKIDETVKYNPENGKNTEYVYRYGIPNYLVINQAEGGSDFTLCCKNLSTELLDNAEELKLNKKVEVDLKDKEYWENPYSTEIIYKITPPESGYYKLEFVAEDCEDFWVDSIPYNWGGPDTLAFYRFDSTRLAPSDSCKSIAYLEKGNAYFFTVQPRCSKDVPVSFMLQASDEEEFNAWRESGSELESFDNSIEATIDEVVTLAFEATLDEEGFWGSEKVLYKFTADKDMTVVAYSEGSNDAYAYIYNEYGKRIIICDDNGTTADFAAFLEFKAGETCYIEVGSNGMFFADDTFDFKITDINDYKFLIE